MRSKKKKRLKKNKRKSWVDMASFGQASEVGITNNVVTTDRCLSRVDEGGFEVVESESQLFTYDANLLEKARTQWQFGDWESLAKLQRETLQNHPERAKLALLASAGHMQSGSLDQARRYVRHAQEWGCSKLLVSRILIAGVHNSLGRAAAVGNQQHRALEHFENAISIGTPGSDTKLLTQARTGEQLRQLDLRKNKGAYPEVDASWTASHYAKRVPICVKAECEDGEVKTRLKIFGTMRSGTNYLRALVEWNTPAQVVFSAVGGWKHAPINDMAVQDLVKLGYGIVTLVKNPWASLVSLHKYYTEVGLNIRSSSSWDDFLRSRFVVFDGGKKSLATEHRFANPVEYWNAMVWSALTFVDRNPSLGAIVRYEDMLTNPADSLRVLSQKFGFPFFSKVADDLKSPKNKLKRMGDGVRQTPIAYMTDEVFNAEYYESKKFLQMFSEKDFSFVGSTLDTELLERLRYFSS